MMNIMNITSSFKMFVGILLFFLLAVFLLSLLSRTRKRSYLESEERLSIINAELEAKTAALVSLNETIHNRTTDRTVMLSQVETAVLDIYERSHIRIPADIIEELSYMQLSTETEVFDYIENQRQFWKLENSKKPYKGGVINGR